MRWEADTAELSVFITIVVCTTILLLVGLVAIIIQAPIVGAIIAGIGLVYLIVYKTMLIIGDEIRNAD